MIALLLGLSVLPGMTAAAATDSNGFEVKAHVYLTPPAVVSRVGGRDDGQGGISGTQVGGTVTSQFPEATVFLTLDAADGVSDDAVLSAIGENFRFQCGDVLSERLTAMPMGGRVFPLRGTSPERRISAVFRKVEASRHAEFSALLRLAPLIMRGSNRVLELRCEIIHRDTRHDVAKTLTVLNRVVEIEPHVPVLIGFPCEDPVRGRFLYWIALLYRSGDVPAGAGHAQRAVLDALD